MSDNHLTILVVEPGKPPYPRQIPDTLQAMQEIIYAKPAGHSFEVEAASFNMSQIGG